MANKLAVNPHKLVLASIFLAKTRNLRIRMKNSFGPALIGTTIFFYTITIMWVCGKNFFALFRFLMQNKSGRMLTDLFRIPGLLATWGLFQDYFQDYCSMNSNVLKIGEWSDFCCFGVVNKLRRPPLGGGVVWKTQKGWLTN